MASGVIAWLDFLPGLLLVDAGWIIICAKSGWNPTPSGLVEATQPKKVSGPLVICSGAHLLAVGIVEGAFDQDVVLIFDFWAAMASTGIRFVVDSMGEQI
ncbi:hypothetical protein DAPPUDRAFT_248427 [Daphnia pulex]|uniref:Uncharacterized protein n=1 Tax=Daphnia pulex TaxID=6669 RepID=E9GUN0_DAPPU|nr:hypothetical protein DAPPUDRAFT_248427 [Daphnia pulex]|eukprot:EFX76757.1 hypothetical protein DAPPUDRAFT_248427 [Daphnia pulex]